MAKKHFKISFCSDQFAAELHYVEFTGSMVTGHVTLRRAVGQSWQAMDGHAALVAPALAALGTAALRAVTPLDPVEEPAAPAPEEPSAVADAPVGGE